MVCQGGRFSAFFLLIIIRSSLLARIIIIIIICCETETYLHHGLFQHYITRELYPNTEH